MDNTTNYNLKKPAPTDAYNIQDFNDNADIIDQELKNSRLAVNNELSTEAAGLFGVGNVDDAFKRSIKLRDNSSYLAFCTNANANSLDAAFGKLNELELRDVGRQLAMYAVFKGHSKEDPNIINMFSKETFLDVCAAPSLKNFLFNTSYLYDLIKLSPYAFNILKTTPAGLPDIVLYQADTSDYLNLAGASNSGMNTFTREATRMIMIESSSGSSLSTGTVTIPTKTTLTNFPFKGYGKLKIQFSTSPTSGIASGYSGGGFGITMGGKALTTPMGASGIIERDNFDNFLTLNNITNMIFNLSGSDYSSNAWSSKVYLEKIWISEV